MQAPLAEALESGGEPSPEPQFGILSAYTPELEESVSPSDGELIAETARGLDYDWARCYLFVRDQIRFTPYPGILRGPERTLLDCEGNAADQALLLVALLRASGHTATLMHVTPPADAWTGGFRIPLGGTESGYDAAAWLGCATGTFAATWSDVGERLASAGLTAHCGGSGASLAGYDVRVEHYWTGLVLGQYLYYLDPSFKPRQATPPRDILADAGYNRASLLTTAGGTVGTSSVQGISSDGLGRGWWTAFDALDRVTGTTDPRGRSRQYAHDPLGRRTAAVKPSGATDAFGYDGLGNWTAHTNAEGRVYTMAYDALGRLVAATNAANEQVFVNRYDAAGNLTNRTDGAGNTVRYAYDELNRLVKRESGIGNRESAFSYNAVGNLLTASNETATLSFAYDAMDRLTSAATSLSNATFTATYTRDAGGLVTNLVYASGKAVTRAYDPDGRLASVSDWLGHTWTFAWDGAGKPTGGTAPGGILTTNHYDAAGRLSAWSVGTLAGRTVTRDLAGLKTREDITAGPHPAPQNVRYAENSFDAADRLVSASVRYGSHTNAAVSETYLYDGNGALTNLLTRSREGREESPCSFSYNPLGQLATLSQPSTLNPQSFSYDALGNRLVANSVVWIPDHADPLKRPLIEADAATGEPIRYYLWGPGRLLGFIDAVSGTLTVAHCDEYGSVVALTDASGNTLHTACYGPNGQDWGTTGTNPTPFAWLGGHGVQKVAVSDHLGPLYLTRYRLYAASLQRFLSPDPMGLAGGLNLYAYAEGDPLTYIDPLGLCGQSVWGAAASGFLEGLGGGLSILANTFTFGGTDALGWTDSASYEGSQYTVSRVTATVARETAITAATLGIGTAARGGSAAAQAAYKGILATQSATGGYQVGTGARQIAEGDYEAGAVNIVAGGLRIGGSIASAGAVAPKGGLDGNPFKGKTPQQIDDMLKAKGFTPTGPDPAAGKGSYINPQTGRKYYIDPGGTYKKGVELPHVDVHRPPTSTLPKKKLPLGDSLYE